MKIIKLNEQGLRSLVTNLINEVPSSLSFRSLANEPSTQAGSNLKKDSIIKVLTNMQDQLETMKSAVDKGTMGDELLVSARRIASAASALYYRLEHVNESSKGSYRGDEQLEVLDEVDGGDTTSFDYVMKSVMGALAKGFKVKELPSAGGGMVTLQVELDPTVHGPRPQDALSELLGRPDRVAPGEATWFKGNTMVNMVNVGGVFEVTVASE